MDLAIKYALASRIPLWTQTFYELINNDSPSYWNTTQTD
jgi:hypothetical protein